jgi:site-specific recombinase XerD
MNRSIEEIICYAKDSLATGGLTEDYIKQLSHTWNAFTRFIHESGESVTRKSGDDFLQQFYGIPHQDNYLSLTAINKRRKRAITILVNCAEHDAVAAPRSYLLSRFDWRYESVFSAFIDYRKKQDLSLQTINMDIHCLNKLSQYLAEVNLEHLALLESSHFVGFMKWLSTTKQLPTMRKAVSMLRLFSKYLYQSGSHLQDFSEHIPKVKKSSEKIPSTYKPAEIQTMLDVFNRSSQVGCRNYAMVLLAARLGMRASDICALKLEDLNWHTSTISFCTIKTGKYTVLPLTEEVGGAIIEYLRNGRPTTQDRHVFIRFQKPYRELRPTALHAVVTKAMRDAGIIIQPGKRHGPHALRASLASEMLSHNIPLYVISEALSHDSLDTTRIYLKIDVAHLRDMALDVPHLGNIWMGGAPV